MNFKEYRKKIATKSLTKYVLVLKNRETLEDKLSITLTPLNLILLLSGIFVLFAFIILFLFTRTPLREYAYRSQNETFYKNEFLKMNNLKDSLMLKIENIEKERQNLLNILSGNDSIYQNVPLTDTANVSLDFEADKISEDEAKFREEYEKTSQNLAEISPFELKTFFPPLKGFITDTFNTETNHFAIDIASAKNTAIKSIGNGTVIATDWTPENGNIIIIQHSDNVISVYKHSSAILKKSGSYVSAGEPIALVGTTGELSSGYHLHFEMWKNGTPVNPKDFIIF
ncbi:MAG: M23 family metallopeptidase [Bacteroidetes bacterium]|nr:M23 family metallopeptidase [Bacteroidota bacterium]